jgi:hypothetical protein
MSQPPIWIQNPPIGNQYIFRDSTGKIIRTYNMDQNKDSLEFFLQKVPFVNRTSNYTVVSLLNSSYYYASAYHPYLKKIFNCNVLSFDYNDSIQRKQLKTGLMDTLGNVVVPVEYEELIFANTLIIAMKNKRYGLLDPTGKTLVPTNYESHTYRGTDPYIYFKNGTHYDLAYHISSGKVISLQQFEAPVDDKHGIFEVKKGSLIGAVNILSNEAVIPCLYDYVHLFHHYGEPDNVSFVVRRNGKFGLYSPKGKVLLPCVYDKVPEWDNTNQEYILKTIKDGKMTMIRFPLKDY